MSVSQDHPPAEAFFLDAMPGKRFALYHAPNAATPCRGAFIYVHPFGDEMNKSRRMAALQAKAFAASGYAVLQIDLFGCGDSSGKFRDATWDIWKADLEAARTWLCNRVAVSVSLWGLRLGALLALDFARSTPGSIDRIVLWQPVMKGELFLTQFLRLRLASEMLAGDTAKNTGTHAMRKALKAGEVLEVAGYELCPGLAAAIDKLDATEWVGEKKSVDWFEIMSESKHGLTPASERVANAWTAAGANLNMHQVQCASFWLTQEITECPALLSATTQLFGTSRL
jgi:exosortase A-associated hydrolase 2